MAETTQQTRNDNADVRPFNIVFPQSDLADLRRRINATRWPEIETVTGDSQGVRLALMHGRQRPSRCWLWRGSRQNLAHGGGGASCRMPCSQRPRPSDADHRRVLAVLRYLDS